jgi:hypothetical protein
LQRNDAFATRHSPPGACANHGEPSTNLISLAGATDDQGFQLFPAGAQPQQDQADPGNGGFEIHPNGLPLPKGSTVQIKLAYVVTRGNPFKKYDANDFDLSNLPIITELEGCSIVEMGKNKALITINKEEFLFSASGFDVNRDLIIDAEATPLA